MQALPHKKESDSFSLCGECVPLGVKEPCVLQGSSTLYNKPLSAFAEEKNALMASSAQLDVWKET